MRQYLGGEIYNGIIPPIPKLYLHFVYSVVGIRPFKADLHGHKLIQ